MQRIVPKLLPAALLLALAVPAAAQNGSAGQPGAGTPAATNAAPPQPGTSAPPAAGTTPPAATAVPVTIEPAQPVVVAPVVQPPPQQPVMIQPDVAYPNGFADPAENYLVAPIPSRQGYPWGLLGLFGLLGLIPLIRGNGRVRTVYVERDDVPRRVVRERIEEE